jgi:hypothetical protein
MAGHVGQRLLHDLEGGQVGPGGQGPGPGRPLDGGAHPQPGRLRPRDQAVQVGQAGGGRPAGRPLLALAEHVQHRPQLLDGVVGGLLDGRQGAAGLARLLVHQVQGHPGLDVDQGDVVGEHVVELTGDPHALLAGAPPGLLGPGPLGGQAPLAAGHSDPGQGQGPVRVDRARGEQDLAQLRHHDERDDARQPGHHLQPDRQCQPAAHRTQQLREPDGAVRHRRLSRPGRGAGRR